MSEVVPAALERFELFRRPSEHDKSILRRREPASSRGLPRFVLTIETASEPLLSHRVRVSFPERRRERGASRLLRRYLLLDVWAHHGLRRNHFWRYSRSALRSGQRACC